MSDWPAIVLIEFRSIAAGTLAADAMVKASPIATLRVGTIQPGRFLVLAGGGTAEVETAHAAGIRTGAGQVLDDVILHDVHPQVAESLAGERRADREYDTLTVLETTTCAAILRAVDPAVKGAPVDLLELRMGDGLGGKGLAMLAGERGDVEAAVEIAAAALAGRSVELCHSIVSRIEGTVAAALRQSSRFSPLEVRPGKPAGGGPAPQRRGPRGRGGN